MPPSLCGLGDDDYSRRMAHDALRAGDGIRAEDHDSYCILAGRADAGLVLLCDHAGNAMPPGYGSLGLPPEQLRRHIAYDIGAAGVTRALAAALGAPAVMTRYSRLLIDPNRGPDDPTLIMRLSDGAVVPGNRRLDAAERDKRMRLYYQPYHRAVDAVVDRCLASGVPPSLLSIHSFTESWKSGRGRGTSACCGTGTGASPDRCSTASTPRAISSSATTSPIRASSRAIACGSMPPAAASSAH